MKTVTAKHVSRHDDTRVDKVKSLPYKPSSVTLADMKKAVDTVIRQRRASQITK